jgi:hypothetical protein
MNKALLVRLSLTIPIAACASDPNATTPMSMEEPRVDPCADPAAAATEACRPPIAPYQGQHPIDRVLHPLYANEGVTFTEANNTELCRRLSGDLLGRLPSREEIRRDCEGKTAAQIALDFQARDEYLLVSERHWRDRFDTDDVVVDWRYLKDLYRLVDELHRGQLRYDEFAIRAMGHPGLVMTEFLPDDMARRAFRVFLGREASDAEAADLAGLYRLWVPAQVADPDFPYLYRLEAYLLPYLCEPIARCSATLFGGGEVRLPGFRLETYIAYDTLTDAEKDALSEAGRLFVRQPFFWEAAADSILNRLLAWSDGGRFPREPGIVLPEVRQVVAEYLRDTGDYPGAERLVITSSLYQQTAQVAPDGRGDDPDAPSLPVWAFGPVKPSSAETWLDSIAPMTFVDMGTCDPRYPDYYPYFLMYDAYERQMITLEQLEQDMAALHAMQESRISMAPGYYEIMEPSYLYTYYARLIGGCPGFMAERQEPSGLAFGFAQETIAELACATGTAQFADPPQGFSLNNAVTHQMRTLFGREPEADELASFTEAFSNNCTGEDCTEAGIVRSVCTALTGAAEMLFY